MTTARRRIVIAVAVAGVAVAGIGGFLLWQVFGGDAPAPAHLAAPSMSAPAGSSSDGGAEAGLDGSWTVDDASGSLTDGTSTFAGYRIEEQLSGFGANEAVGRTQDVTGSMTIDGTTITDLSISVDMSTLQSDDGRRDNSLRSRGLETDLFPTATFELTEPIRVQPRPERGEQVKMTAAGDLTLHGVTKQVEVPITAQVTSTGIETVATLDVALADYQIQPPTGFAVLSIADTGTIEMHLLFGKG